MNIRSLLFLSLASAATTQAAIIVEYTTDASTTFATLAANANSAPEVSGDDLTAGTGLTANTGSTWNWFSWDPNSTSYADAVAANEYWTWGFDVTSAVTIDLTTMDIRVDRSASGPDDFEIQASINGGTPISLLTYDFAGGSAGVTFSAVDISALGTVGNGDSVVFTLAAFNSTNNGGTFDLENISGTNSLQINGNITPVPEPTTALLGALGMLFLLRRRK